MCHKTWATLLSRSISCPKANTWYSLQSHKIWQFQPFRRYFRGCKILKLVTWPWPRPFHGRFVIGRLGHHMTNLPTIFEVSSFARYWDMKGVENAQNGVVGVVRVIRVVSGDPRSSAMSPFYRMHTTSYSSLIEAMRLFCTVLEIQRVSYRNSPTFPYLTCIWRPRWGWPWSNFEKIFGVRKLVPGLSCGVVCVILSVAFLIQYRLVTDTQTDRRTGRPTHDDS